MRKNYSKPELNVSSFEVADVITASTPTNVVYTEENCNYVNTVDYTAIFGA